MSTTIRRTVIIDAPAQRVWDVLGDLDRLAEYDPIVTESTIVGTQSDGIGARRRCVAAHGRYFVEDVTMWEPPVGLHFTIVECNLPTRDLTHTYTLQAAGTSTRVTEEMRYAMRFGLAGAVLNRLLMQRKTASGIEGFLAGLKATVERSGHS